MQEGKATEQNTLAHTVCYARIMHCRYKTFVDFGAQSQHLPLRYISYFFFSPLIYICICPSWQINWSTSNSCKSHQENAVFCSQKKISGKQHHLPQVQFVSLSIWRRKCSESELIFVHACSCNKSKILVRLSASILPYVEFLKEWTKPSSIHGYSTMQKPSEFVKSA